MSVIAKMAAARAKRQPPTRAELIEQARCMVSNPDTAATLRPMLLALLAEINAGKDRLAVAIQYAARYRRG